MSLEGRLRDLGLPEVCQLLGSSRKTGTLRVHAPLEASSGEVRFVQGMIAEATRWPMHGARDEASSVTLQQIESCVLEMLVWREGDFRFVAEKASARCTSAIRLSVESMLVEAAHRAEVWERVRDRVPNARVVPTFVDMESSQLPLLRLVPQEWEVLTRVDGRRNLAELSAVLERNLLDVAQIVHALIGASVLALREGATVSRRHPTPPAHGIIPQTVGADLWTPLLGALHGAEVFGQTSELVLDSTDEDLVFDPIAQDVLDEPGVPRAELGLVDGRVNEALPDSDVVAVATRMLQAASVMEFRDSAIVTTDIESAVMDAAAMSARGDASARVGDLADALSWWSAALRADAGAIDADRVREAIALAARLHALLHPSLEADACRS